MYNHKGEGESLKGGSEREDKANVGYTSSSCTELISMSKPNPNQSRSLSEISLPHARLSFCCYTSAKNLSSNYAVSNYAHQDYSQCSLFHSSESSPDRNVIVIYSYSAFNHLKFPWMIRVLNTFSACSRHALIRGITCF